MKTEYVIPECNYNRFTSHIDALNKICKKLNKTEVVVEKIREDVKIVKVLDDNDPIKTKTIHVIVVKVTGVAPVIDGYTFKSILNIEDNEKFVRSIAGFNLPSEFRERDICDHCNQNRKRNRYFFVQKDDSNLKQVGSSCVKDFLGHKNPETIAEWFELIHEIDEYEEYAENDRSLKTHPIFELDMVIQLINNTIKNNGFTSVKSSNDSNGQKLSTSELVKNELFDIDNGQSVKPEINTETVNSIKKHISDMEGKDDSDYVYNLKNAIFSESGYIKFRQIGVMCAGINSWIRKVTENVNKIPSQYFGTIGDKVILDITVLNSFGYEGSYGICYINIMIDSESRIYVWSTGKSLEKGEVLKIKGTIKDHSTRLDIKQTILTRCKII